MSVSDTLETRGTKYGEYETLAATANEIKEAIKRGLNYGSLDPDMKESLDMIAHKIARILNGDPYYVDSWHDISGYATLVEDRLRKL